jgi:hypothetical protein
MRRFLFAGLVAALAAVALTLAPPRTSAAPPLTEDGAAKLRNVIRPAEGEDPFDTIPWQTSLWDARVKAAAAGKPILLWEMDGHPLGCG